MHYDRASHAASDQEAGRPEARPLAKGVPSRARPIAVLSVANRCLGVETQGYATVKVQRGGAGGVPTISGRPPLRTCRLFPLYIIIKRMSTL